MSRPAFEGALDRGRTYAQGMTEADKDYADGHRDALRVIAGLEPFRRGSASPAYVRGWYLAVDEAGLRP